MSHPFVPSSPGKGDPTVTRQDIRQAIHDLDLSGSPVIVHSSLRSFGNVEGGADSIVEGLLDEGCTVMAPAFSSYFAISPPEGMRPERNAWDYSVYWALPRATEQVYTSRSNIFDDDMGAIPKTIIARRDRDRGNHPLNSFVAVGPLAFNLIRDQRPDDVYAPLSALGEADGYVVLMGVGLDRMTALHLAEAKAGRTLFRRWALDIEGRPIMVEIGSCSNGFPRLDTVLAQIERRLTVGQSLWRVFPVREALGLAADAIRRDPEITHCSDADCVHCRDSIAGGPLLLPHET